MAAYAALLSLMNIIDTLENHPRPPISLPKNQVHLLTQKITFLQQFLESYNPNLAYTAEADPLETRIADAAYAAEDVIESYIVDHIIDDAEKMTYDVFHEAVEKVIEEMALIEKEAMQIKLQTLSVGLQHHQLHTKSTPTDSPSVAQVQQQGMVGADELLLQMKDKLRSDRLDLQVIPIVGMGGSGKTTLAITIYQDRLIKEHFHVRAWVTISQEYSMHNILAQLLKLEKEDSQDLSEGELGDMLHQHLFGRKYLIVLDDMWSIEAWEGLRMFLPNNTNGSRIVVTTRLSILASKLPNSSSLEMNLLDEDDSWHLLSKTVFGEKDCPLELEKIGKEIGRSCKGLPLSIVVVGGLLAKSQHTIKFWESIRENINSVVNLADDERYFQILYTSYKHLPVHLKPCFLYMGVFREDSVIRTKRLFRLWVAEGFVKAVGNKSMEEIAKEYLGEFIGRNLIMIHELGSIGKIKKCKIHDLLRDLCVREAEKERFYSVVASPPPQGIVYNGGQRRIVVSSSTSKDEAINAMSSMPLARSLIWNLKDGELPALKLRLLRILESSDARSMATETCLESVYQLVNSRYINISSFKCPHSIVRFWNLQTFYCRSMKSDLSRNFLLEMIQVIESSLSMNFLLDMIQIRHIQFTRLEFENNRLQGALGNLQTLGKVYNFELSKEIVKRIRNIKKLSMVYNGLFSDKYCLTNLICLDKLESFACSIIGQIDHCSGRDSLQELISFPNSLIKLSIELHKEIFWQEILDKIGSLPLLQKLTLQYGAFKDGQWETTDGQFGRLKVLILDSCVGPRVWTTECSHFPCLERLRLKWIQQLEEIPLEFAEILTLKEVEVFCCSDSAVESAKRIVEEQEELYGDQEAALQVHVTLSEDQEENQALTSLASPNFCLF